MSAIYTKANVDTHTLEAIMVEDESGEWKVDDISIARIPSSD